MVDATLDRNAAEERVTLVRARATNRKLGDGSPLGNKAVVALRRTAKAAGTHLRLVLDHNLRTEIGCILGAFDKIQFTTPVIHQETMAEMRWTPAEVALTRDGIDIATLELEPMKAAALRLARRADVAALLRQPGRGTALEEMAQTAIATSSAVGLLRVEVATPDGFVEAGRVMQRIWLDATRLGKVVCD